MNNQAVITNLEALLIAVQAQPEELFDLNFYRQVEPCGTLFCTAGLAATLPHFQALGLDFKVESRLNWTIVTVKGVDVDEADGEMTPIFGADAFKSLFTVPGEGTWDDNLGYESEGWDDDEPSLSDKELAIERLKFRIEQLKAAA